MTVGQLQHYCQLLTRYQILGYSQWITNQVALCELNKIWPRDSNTWACCLSVVYNVPDFRRLAMGHKPSSCLCTGYNVAKIFGCQSLLLSIVCQISDSRRLAVCHKPGRHLWAGTNTAKRFQCQSLLLPIVYNMSDSWRLTMHRKLHGCLWVGYNVVNRFQNCYKTEFQWQPHSEFHTKKRAK